MTWAIAASIGLSLGLLPPHAVVAAVSTSTAVPADGRLRGQDFAAQVTKVSWPDEVDVDSMSKLAPRGERYVTFSYTVAEDAQALQPDGPDPDITAALRVGGRTSPIVLDTLNGPSGAGPEGWTSGAGEDTVVVPDDSHAVDFVVSQGSFSQRFNLWTLRRAPPAPLVLYRDPAGPSISATAPPSTGLSLSNPSDGFVNTATLSVQSATLGYFGPAGTVIVPSSPQKSVLSVVLDAEAPNDPSDQTTSGHYLGAQAPLPGSMVTFTPAGGSPVTATLSDAGNTRGKGNSDDGLFDGTYSFVVPSNVSSGTLEVHAGAFTGAEFTLYTAESGPTTLDVTAPATLALTFPALTSPAVQRTPPWVGQPLPPTAAQASAGSNGSSGDFPLWLAFLIPILVAAGVVLVQRQRRRLTPAEPAVPETTSADDLVSEPAFRPDPTVFVARQAAPTSVDADTFVGVSSDDASSEDDVTVNMLGPVEFHGLRAASDRRIVYELLAYLACHDHRHLRVGQIQIGMWPLGSARAEVSEKTLRNYLSELRASIGPSHLPEATGREGYLLQGVATDWDRFQRLAREADTTGRDTAIALRTEALALVRGRPFEGVDPATYEWVAEEHLDTQMTVAIAACALRLASDHLDAAQPEEALAAARSGLKGAPDDFSLWQAGALALAATGDRTGLRRWLGDAARHVDPTDLARMEDLLGRSHESDQS